MLRGSLGHICSPSLLVKRGKGPMSRKGRWEVRHRQEPQVTDTAQLCHGEKTFPQSCYVLESQHRASHGFEAGTEEMEWKDLQNQCWSNNPGTECSSNSNKFLRVSSVALYHLFLLFLSCNPAKSPEYPNVRLLSLNHLTSAANWSQYRIIDLRRGDFFHHKKASADHIVFNQITLII